MTVDPDFTRVASLLAEPARAAMLARMLDGRSWTATELAKAAAIAPSTGSAHLSRLLEEGWVTVHPQGRHRYFRLANEEVAAFIERFAAIAPAAKARTPGEVHASSALRHCRMCYSHVAGRVGVALAEQLRFRQWVDGSFELTELGREGLDALGLTVLPGEGHPCMDWSERRLHVAGPLGAALAAALLAKDWLQRDPRSRALWVTPRGREGLAALLGAEPLVQVS